MYRYTIYLDGQEVSSDACFDSADEARSEAGFAINCMIEGEYEGHNFDDFEIVVDC